MRHKWEDRGTDQRCLVCGLVRALVSAGGGGLRQSPSGGGPSKGHWEVLATSINGRTGKPYRHWRHIPVGPCPGTAQKPEGGP